MKKCMCLIVGLAVLFIACQKQSLRSFVPGVYVNHSSGKFSLADDTLVIRLEGRERRRERVPDRFVIERRTGFNRIREGRTGKREYEQERWEVVLDEAAAVLNELKHGKVIRLFPDSAMLKIGKRRYDKIK